MFSMVTGAAGDRYGDMTGREVLKASSHENLTRGLQLTSASVPFCVQRGDRRALGW